MHVAAPHGTVPWVPGVTPLDELLDEEPPLLLLEELLDELLELPTPLLEEELPVKPPLLELDPT